MPQKFYWLRNLSFCFTLCLSFTAQAETQFNAGFLSLSATAQTPLIGIWYPTHDQEKQGKIGPFRPRWAWDGTPADGVFPLIILSHGNSGHWRNHRQTAATLARNGYIVAAAWHHQDRQMTSRKKFPPLLRQRVQQLQYALQAVNNHPVIGAVADTHRVGALGYSLGSLSALTAAGATPQMSLFKKHCDQHSGTDVMFCGDDSWQSKAFSVIKSALAWLREKGILKPRVPRPYDDQESLMPLDKPINFRAVALVAPIGAPFSPESIASVTADVALFRMGKDEELRAPWHAEYLHTLLGNQARIYKVFPTTHHYAFISPFPQSLLEKESIPVAIDPPGFDRPAFIQEINGDLVRFFNTYL